MSVEPGQYIIRDTLNHKPVGRFIVEDRSLLPKRVLSLPPDGEVPKWQIEKSSNELYKLRSRGGTAAVIEDRLFATLMDDIGADHSEWLLIPHPEHGINVFNIVAPETGYGWAVNEDDMSQIEVAPMLPNATINLFEVIKVQED
ncbi:hypothetical protein H072_7304 [Dactylellina haptotyla CBS 200.50]|uniref:Uncharacterized protein n=1 Tax=Dactylellina haptotyla (strain CBS 200.50) TaxID=1284197 RepID=S8ACU8_DACHA|nr:hypothetical protein H072_7304 [Dactylellina haptotyla CBS 200.50]